MNLGDKVKCTIVDRVLTYTGKPFAFDPPLNIEGIVVQRSHFIFERYCVSFEHDNQQYTVWKEPQSGEIELIK